MSEVVHRRVSSTLSVSDGSAVNGTNGTNGSRQRPIRRVRKRRRKKSAFQSHFGQERQEILLLVFLGLVLVVLASVVVYKITMGSSGRAAEASIENPVPNETLRQFKNPPTPSWWNKLFRTSGYKMRDSMRNIGDKSSVYASLREEYDSRFPDDPSRSRKAVQQLHKRTYQLKPMNLEGKASYDVYNCPQEPPIGYPYAWNVMDVLENWPPDEPAPRTHIYQGLCVFDYEKDYLKAMNYRTMEKPFVTRNDPNVAKTVERWNSPNYVERLLGDVPHRTEYSENNHFMYWMANRKRKRKKAKVQPRPAVHGGINMPANWTAPTTMMRMRYKEWLAHANVTDDFLGPDKPHWYYRLIGCGAQGTCDRDSSEYLFDELTFFQPKAGLYLTEPGKQKGIHCRFGMKGVIAENHFDGSRNSIVVLGGERRYILSHPDQCERLALLPKNHPSGRHSAIDWSDPDLETYPQFKTAETNEVILQAGDVLYLPTNWFHYIISLELNFQCNTRSGLSNHYMDPIHKCGF